MYRIFYISLKKDLNTIYLLLNSINIKSNTLKWMTLEPFRICCKLSFWYHILSFSSIKFILFTCFLSMAYILKILCISWPKRFLLLPDLLRGYNWYVNTKQECHFPCEPIVNFPEKKIDIVGFKIIFLH